MDREGVVPYDLKVLRSKIYPSDDITLKKFGGWIEELLSKGLLTQIEFQGELYLHAINFKKHQVFSKSERLNEPRYGLYPDCGTSTVQVQYSYSTSTADIGHRTQDIGHRTAQPPPPDGAALLFQLWDSHRGDLPQCKALTEKRVKPASKRFSENPSIDYWKDVIERLARSKFCLGENDRQWRATFDFLIKPDTHVKVLEGKYDNREREEPHDPTPLR